MMDSDDIAGVRSVTIERTNVRGETPTQAFGSAVVEAFAPLLRDAIHGREISEKEARERLKHQLEGRGFEITNRHVNTGTDRSEADE